MTLKIIKQLAIAVLLICNITTRAQNNIRSYSYWFDNDIEGSVTTSITPVSQYTLNGSFSTEGISTGIHTFNIEFLDDSAHVSSVLSQFFFKAPIPDSETKEIVEISYWYDNEISGMISESVDPAQELLINADLEVTGLSTGIHSVNVRFKDNAGMWSSPASQFFFKAPIFESQTNEIVEISYWFDNDISEMITEPIGPAQELLLNADLEVTDLSTGIHSVNVRFKDNAGMWSSPLSQYFFKAPVTTAEDREIIAFQYWVDDASYNANYQTVGPGQIFFLSDIVDLDTLTSGFHMIHAQFLDNSKLWSSIVSSSFYKPVVNSIEENFVTACKYWFDEDASTVEEIVFTDPVNPRTLMMDIDMTNIWKGEHRLHFQFQDSLNLWGAVTTDTVVKSSLPIAIFSCDESICLGDTVHFTNTSIDADTYFWDFGDGTTTADSIPEFHVFEEAGTYTVSLTVTDLVTLLDSTATQIVNVYEIPSPALTLSGDPEFCEGGSVDISAVPGMVYEWSTGETTQTITVTTSGSYFANIFNGSNTACWVQSDMATINVLNIDTTAMDVSICNGESFTFGNQTLTEPGDYTEIFTATSGCDSIVNLTLNITVIDTSVTLNYPVLMANLEDASYQWVDCNNSYAPINGAIEQSFTPDENGNYAVILEKNLCIDTSSCYDVTIIGIKNSFDKQLFMVSPNPTTGIVILQMSEAAEIFVMDGLGNEFYTALLPEGRHSLDFTEKEQGIYIIVFKGQTQTKRIKLIKSF